MPSSALRPYIALLCLVAVAGCAETDRSGDRTPLGGGQAELTVDVSEDMYRFSFAESPRFEDGLPAYGNAFITQGYLYPEGFLDTHDGVAPDGSPAHPENVVGEWTCRGHFVGDGAHTTQGPIVITTQTYALYDEPGYEPAKAVTAANLVTEGFELVDPTPIARPITGGTRAHRGARGESVQSFLGLNATEGVELRVAFDLD